MNMLQQLKSAVKHGSTSHKPSGEKNLFLFSMPRSGTTWLMEIIATQPGFKMVNEPFNLRKEVVRDNLGLSDWHQFFDEGSLPRITDYVEHFIEGKDKDLRYFRHAPFSEFWKLRTDRIIFKLLFIGEGYFDWFRDQFNGEVIYLLRHPVPVSLSRTVHPRLTSFVESAYSQFFTAKQLDFARRVIREGDKFDQAVLDWCFQNAVPLQQMHPGWLVISYEQMVVDPETVLRHMISRYQFEKPELMYARLDKASNSTAKSNAESQQVLLDADKMKENKQWLVEKWLKKVSPGQVDRTFEILDVFEIDFYEKGSVMPRPQYLLD